MFVVMVNSTSIETQFHHTDAHVTAQFQQDVSHTETNHLAIGAKLKHTATFVTSREPRVKTQPKT